MPSAKKDVVKKAILTAEEEREMRRGLALLDETNAFWDQNADWIHKEYGGQWVAFDGGKIVAHSKDAEAIERKLRSRPAVAKRCLIRYVPPPDAEFVFAAR